MNIEISPWVPAILFELVLVTSGLAAWFRHRSERRQEGLLGEIRALRLEVQEARAEARRIEQEALRKRKIVTFEEADLAALTAAGEIAGDSDTIERLKGRLGESAEVVAGMTTGASGVNQKLATVLEKQMEAVNMVGRLGGSGGLPPEVKEKAEAILDVFRSLDEIMSGAVEEMEKLEGGLREVGAALVEFKEADPRVKLPTVDALNAALRKKSDDGASGAAPPEEATSDEEGPGTEPDLAAFGHPEEQDDDEQRV